ncbi:MAG: type II secretion system protein [Halofilum sp. (in: g-proteobacteria)]|nr:type II secretion system protein [Halofilum sp. (in: g-proteobacteria)]
MRARGFTIIELVTVLVIVGALAVFVVPRLNPEGFDRYGFRQEVLSAARYAQKTAMASGCEVQLFADAAADSVALNYRSGGDDRDCGPSTNAFTEPVQNPGSSGPFVLNAPSGVDITSGGTVVFDGYGDPDNGLMIDFATDPDIEIEAVTGYAHEV